MRVGHRWREQSRRHHRQHAIEKGRAGAEADQGEHIEPAGPDRLEPAHEEWPARPQHSRYGEAELQPLLCLGRNERQQVDAEYVGTHVESEQREREGRRYPQPVSEVDQLGIVGVLGERAHRLERHAANRAGARSFLHDLRMHRAGVERAAWQRLRLALLVQIALRILGEFDATAFRAEIVDVAAELRARLAGMRVHRHPADGIGGDMGFGAGFVHGFKTVVDHAAYKDSCCLTHRPLA